MPHVSKDDREENPFVDLFYAVKVNARPITEAVRKPMRLIRRRLKDYRQVTKDSLLACAAEVLGLIRKYCTGNEEEVLRQERKFSYRLKVVAYNELAKRRLTPVEGARLCAIIAAVEKEELEALFPHHDDSGGASSAPPQFPAEAGQLAHEPPEVQVPPAPEEFTAVLSEVSWLVNPLRGWLELLSPPTIEIVRGLTQGQPDPTQFARLTLGADDVHCEEMVRRDNSVTAAFALDTSSSMNFPVAISQKPKVCYGQQLGIVFNAAFEGLPNVTANSWMYDQVIPNCGPCSSYSGIAKATGRGGNCDSYMAAHLWRFFCAHPAQTMVAIFAADSGPDSFEQLGNQVRALRQLSVVTVQFFIETEADRDSEASAKLDGIFDYRIVFDAETIDKMGGEFGALLRRIYGNP